MCNYTDVMYESMSGTDRFVSGINASKKLYPNGTKNVVLISYTDIVDGYLSVPLTSSLDAPILMVKPDSITNEVLAEEVGESREQIRRYIRLTNLIP